MKRTVLHVSSLVCFSFVANRRRAHRRLFQVFSPPSSFFVGCLF